MFGPLLRVWSFQSILCVYLHILWSMETHTELHRHVRCWCTLSCLPQTGSPKMHFNARQQQPVSDDLMAVAQWMWCRSIRTHPRIPYTLLPLQPFPLRIFISLLNNSANDQKNTENISVFLNGWSLVLIICPILLDVTLALLLIKGHHLNWLFLYTLMSLH